MDCPQLSLTGRSSGEARISAIWRAREVFAVLTKKVMQPGDEEIRNNPRSRSAKMRVAEKLATAEAGVWSGMRNHDRISHSKTDR